MTDLRLFLFFACLLSALSPWRVEAECKVVGSAPVDSSPPVLASAGTWDNYRENPGSLAFESKRLLQKLESQLTDSESCSVECGLGEVGSEMIFRSIPHRFLDDYGDRSFCEGMHRLTKEQRLRFGEKEFPNIEKLYEWFSEFSQGKGAEGKSLYERCSRSCSPQYFLRIRKIGTAFRLVPEVVCGPARDKEDNNYELSVGRSQGCNEPSSMQDLRDLQPPTSNR